MKLLYKLLFLLLIVGTLAWYYWPKGDITLPETMTDTMHEEAIDVGEMDNGSVGTNEDTAMIKDEAETLVPVNEVVDSPDDEDTSVQIETETDSVIEGEAGDLVLVYKGKEADGYSFDWELIGASSEELGDITWYLVRNTEKDPVYNDNTYWYRSRATLTSLVVDDELTEGTHYFRVCQSIGDECVKYSNNVEVEIK